MPWTQKAEPKITWLSRVSTDVQDLARQRADAERVKKKFGAKITKTIELQGVSGTETLNHIDVRKVLDGLAGSDVDGIGISSLDRLFRPGRRYGQFEILDPFVAHGKAIWTVREGFVDPDTDEGYDKCIAAGGRAGAEWRELLRRTQDGMMEKLAQGILTHRGACYGYIYRTKHDPLGRGLFLDPAPSTKPGWSKQDVVRYIFRLRRSGMPVHRIMRILYNEGILSAGITRKKSGIVIPPGGWARQTLLKLLRNPTYVGKHVCRGVVVPCPAIVDQETFDIVQSMREESRQTSTGRPTDKYLLTGFVWCGRCGRRCTQRSNGQGYIYFRCGNYMRRPPFTRICDAPEHSLRPVEAKVFELIWGMLTDAKMLISLARAYTESMEKAGDQTGKLNREAERLRTRIIKTQRMIQNSVMEFEEGKRSIEADRLEVSRIEQELARCGRVTRMPAESAIRAHVNQVRQCRRPTDIKDQRKLIEHLLELRVTLNDDDLRITGRVGIDPETRNKCNHGERDGYTSSASIPFVINGRLAA